MEYVWDDAYLCHKDCLRRWEMRANNCKRAFPSRKTFGPPDRSPRCGRNHPLLDELSFRLKQSSFEALTFIGPFFILFPLVTGKSFLLTLNLKIRLSFIRLLIWKSFTVQEVDKAVAVKIMRKSIWFPFLKNRRGEKGWKSWFPSSHKANGYDANRWEYEHKVQKKNANLMGKNMEGIYSQQCMELLNFKPHHHNTEGISFVLFRDWSSWV